MKILTTTLALLALAAPLQYPVAARNGGLPDSAIPDAFGTAIHFLEQAPATRANGRESELDRLSQAAAYVRIDLFWSSTEPVSRKGRPSDERYDFSRYDRLIHDLQSRTPGAPGRPLNVMLLLVYNNPLYWSREHYGRKRVLDPAKPGDASDPLAVNPSIQIPPDTPEERAGYARWAARAVEHFGALRRDRYPDLNIIWEVWNEPNISPFWGKRPNAADYAALVAEAAPAMRKADPEATIVVGALSNVDLEFAEQIARRGALRDADAFSVHPYGLMPELLQERLLSLRRILDRQSPNRHIPIVVSEVGFYTVKRPNALSELDQARYLVRARLLHLSQGIRGSVYYDWKNDGRDPTDPEQNFGMVVQSFEASFPFDKGGKGGVPRGLETVPGLAWADALAPKPGESAKGKVADVRVSGFRKGDSIVLRPVRGFEDEMPSDAEAIGMWVYGDAGKDLLQFRAEDEDGKVLGTTAANAITWRGWRWVSFPLNVPDPKTGERPIAPSSWHLVVSNGTGTTHDVHIQVDDIGAFRTIFNPKPAYTAARVLNETLDNFAFVRTLTERRGEFHILLRERSAREGRPRTAVALWSTGLQVCGADGACDPPNTYTVPEGASGTLVDMLVTKKRRVKGGQVIPVGASPQYIVFDDRSSGDALGNLDLMSSWTWTVPDGSGGSLPLAWSVVPTSRALSTTLRLGNRTEHALRYDEISVRVDGAEVALDLDLPITIQPGGSGVAIPVRIEQWLCSPGARAYVKIRATDLEARGSAKRTDEAEIPIVVDEPVTIEASPIFRGSVQVRLRASDGGLPGGPLSVTVESPEYGVGRATLAIPADRHEDATVSVPMPDAPKIGSPSKPYSLRVRVSTAGREVARMESLRYQRGITFDDETPDESLSGIAEYLGGYDTADAGRTRPQRAAGRKAAATIQAVPERGRVADVRLTFQPGLSYLSLITRQPHPVPSDATAIGLWVNGNASGDTLSVNFVDRTGQTHQVRSGPLDWTGWRWLVLPLDDPTAYHWTPAGKAGRNDGSIHRPLRLETILGVDGSRGEEHGRAPGAAPHESHIQFDDITFLSPRLEAGSQGAGANGR